MISRFERYMAHLDRLSGGVAPTFTPFPSSSPDLAQVTAMTYLDHPKPGHLVGLTYGLSLADPQNFRVDVSPESHEGHDMVDVVGLYPIHEVERQFIADQRPEAFWNLEWDSFDVTRAPAV